MSIYLPIAELPINILLLLALGGFAGILSGMFGIGGGFLMTPLLIFIGVPPSVAVATSANQIVAASVSGFLAHWRRQNVDIKMGLLLLIGGIVGSSFGVGIFTFLKALGQIDLVISLIYVFFLGTVGTLMALESSRTILHKKRGTIPPPKKKHWLHNLPLPFVMHFPRSELTISAFLPIGIGMLSGILVSLMGIGGGFVLIPAMIYVLGMPTSVVIGTSLFQTIFTTSNVTILHAATTHSVDIVLALILLTGSVVGAQVGSNMSLKVAPEKLRIMLALMVLAVCLRLAFGLFLRPEELYSISVVGQ
ncbi:MAG: sulfite exporter TauE/SafE family protein [Proteobacteria bacterium]|nr:sulfite exporter TauE/SafE family protein [Pseudomonadota bacterium]